LGCFLSWPIGFGFRWLILLLKQRIRWRLSGGYTRRCYCCDLLEFVNLVVGNTFKFIAYLNCSLGWLLMRLLFTWFSGYLLEDGTTAYWYDIVSGIETGKRRRSAFRRFYYYSFIVLLWWALMSYLISIWLLNASKKTITQNCLLL
jgi:hypothetical protein